MLPIVTQPEILTGDVCPNFMKLDGNTSRNVAAGFLTGSAAGGFACFQCLVEYWRYKAPASPDVGLGLLYRHNEHGAITYFSAFQTTACYLLFFTFPVIFLIGFSLAPKTNVRVKSGRLSWAMRFDPDDPKKLFGRSQLAGIAAAPVVIFTIGRLFVRILISYGIVLTFG